MVTMNAGAASTTGSPNRVTDWLALLLAGSVATGKEFSSLFQTKKAKSAGGAGGKDEDVRTPQAQPASNPVTPIASFVACPPISPVPEVNADKGKVPMGRGSSASRADDAAAVRGESQAAEKTAQKLAFSGNAGELSADPLRGLVRAGRESAETSQPVEGEIPAAASPEPLVDGNQMKIELNSAPATKEPDSQNQPQANEIKVTATATLAAQDRRPDSTASALADRVVGKDKAALPATNNVNQSGAPHPVPIGDGETRSEKRAAPTGEVKANGNTAAEHPVSQELGSRSTAAAVVPADSHPVSGGQEPHSRTVTGQGEEIASEPAAPARSPVALQAVRLTERMAGPELQFNWHSPDGGQVQISASLHDHREVQIAVSTDRPEAASAIRAEIPSLDNRLQEHALRLGEVRVNSGGQALTAGLGTPSQQQGSREWTAARLLPSASRVGNGIEGGEDQPLGLESESGLVSVLA